MEEFIMKITEQMRCVRAREHVAKELKDHIMDQAAAYEEHGRSHEEALQEAVREMGDPVEVGMELDRIHRPQTDYKMIGMAFLFSLGGLFLLYTTGGMSAVPGDFARQCFYLLLSFVVMAGMYFLDYTFIGRYAHVIYIVLTVLLIVRVVLLPMPEGYYGFPDMRLFVYLYLPVYGGILYQMRGKGYAAVGWAIILLMITAALSEKLPSSMHAGLVVYGVCMILLLCAIRREWFAVNRKVAAAAVTGVLVLIPAALFVVMVCGDGEDSFRMMRIRAFLNPEEYASGAGYLYAWIRQQAASVRLVGPSGGIAFTDWLGEPYTYRSEPFILLQIVCRYGLLAGAALLLAFGIFIVHAFLVVKRQKNQLGYILSMACFLVFLANCTAGILANTGYYPLTGMQFPFVSYGIGAAVTYAVLLGLLLSIYRNEKIVAEGVAVLRPRWRLSIRLEKK